ncbi:MAG: M17 family peptidase N-terminal domain-containing protein, partial [Pseudomonadota bacterium]
MPIRLNLVQSDAALGGLAEVDGAVAAFWRPAEAEGGAPQLTEAATALDALTGGQVARALAKAKGERGEVTTLTAPHGMAADALLLIGCGADALDALGARKLGGALAKSVAAQKLETVQVRLEGLGSAEALTEFALGLQLRAYAFDLHKSDAREEAVPTVALAGGEFDGSAAAALAEGVALSRDLVNEPANVLTPPEFAARIRKLGGSDGHPGLDVEILGEAELEALGMGALLAVGRGSRKESHVAIMRWTGAADPKAAPLCLIGKGVCFDTGGISLKPAGGMEEMTMDMGGAAAVVGAMAAIAGRKSKANVVGVVGLVENMPDGDAQRPGDVVTAMSGDTIEVINTDAEGRLVLADV